MSGSLLIFIISFIGMAAIISSNYFYKRKPKFLIESDKAILNWMEQGKEWLRYVNKKTLGLFAHYLLVKIEDFFNSVFKKLKSIVKK